MKQNKINKNLIKSWNSLKDQVNKHQLYLKTTHKWKEQIGREDYKTRNRRITE